MTRHTSRADRDAAPRQSVYAEITAKILSQLEAGRFPWVQPWSAAKAGLDMPRNAATGRRYGGINILLLWNAVVERGFTGHKFLTFRQALALGGHVRKGERGTTVIYADRFAPESEKQRAYEEDREPDQIPFLKRFTVFSTDQCDGLPPEIAAPPPPIPEGLVEPRVQALIDASGADFRIGGDEAYYSVTHDFIAVPRPEAFFEPINWHRTACHELCHWSGAAHRLNRDLSGRFGSKGYGKEELIAELGAAFVCAALGIEPTVRHADYLGSWLEVIREDDRAIIRAASAASKAADYLLGFLNAAEITAASERTAA